MTIEVGDCEQAPNGLGMTIFGAVGIFDYDDRTLSGHFLKQTKDCHKRTHMKFPIFVANDWSCASMIVSPFLLDRNVPY